MGEKSRKQRRNDRALDVARVEAKALRALPVADRTAHKRFQAAALTIGGLGLLWPIALSIFASIRGSIIHAPVPSHGKYRYAHVATGWPDFTAPWPVPALLLGALIGITVVLLTRHRHLTAHILDLLAFAWLTTGAGITWVGFMYLGADQWPHWQAGLGIPTVIIGGILWLLNRRRQNHLLRPARTAGRQ